MLIVALERPESHRPLSFQSLLYGANLFYKTLGSSSKTLESGICVRLKWENFYAVFCLWSRK